MFESARWELDVCTIGIYRTKGTNCSHFILLYQKIDAITEGNDTFLIPEVGGEGWPGGPKLFEDLTTQFDRLGERWRERRGVIIRPASGSPTVGQKKRSNI